MSRSSSSSMRRTFSQNAHRNYTFFRIGVKAAIRAGFEAMALDNVKLAFVAGVSCGIYAGPHSVRIGGDFVGMVNEVCSELLEHGGRQQEKRCATFDDVIFVRL